jgi:ParB/RepB/Spo0J family partition protein
MSKRKAALSAMTLGEKPDLRIEQRTGIQQGLLPVESIRPDPNQPRKSFDQKSLLELAQSILDEGLINPITVRPPGVDGFSMIVTGERRWRACQLAGLTTMPVVITYDLGDDADAAAFRKALIENLQRVDLSRREVADGLTKLRYDLGLTIDQLGKHVHKSKAWVEDILAFSSLSEAARHLMDEYGVATQLAQTLRSMDGHDQVVLIDRLKDLPNRAQQSALATYVKQVVRRGDHSVESAITTAEHSGVVLPLATPSPSPNGEKGDRRRAVGTDGAPARRRGRPRLVTRPFDWEVVDGISFLTVSARDLQTVRLATYPRVTADAFLEAAFADLDALAAVCASLTDDAAGVEMWEAVERRLEDLLQVARSRIATTRTG